jgi:hypothetical protein
MNQGGEIFMRPDGPWIMMSRTSAAVSPIRAYWAFFGPVAAMCLIHSAPVRVLPKALPARISQTSQSPSGGRCLSRARSCSRQEPSDFRISGPQSQGDPYQSYFGASRATDWRWRRSLSASRTVIGLIIRLACCASRSARQAPRR